MTDLNNRARALNKRVRASSLLIETMVDPSLAMSDICDLFNVKPKTIGRWCNEGQFGKDNVGRTPGGHRRVKKSAVIALAKKKGIDTSKFEGMIHE
jgi:hypothetical protein